MVIESLRCGGTLDGQLRKTAPVMEEVFNSVQALRGGWTSLLRWVAEDRRAGGREENSSSLMIGLA